MNCILIYFICVIAQFPFAYTSLWSVNIFFAVTAIYRSVAHVLRIRCFSIEISIRASFPVTYLKVGVYLITRFTVFMETAKISVVCDCQEILL